MQSLTIGRELKSLRQSRGLTLDELAALTGVSKPMLGQIERGQSSPTINTLWKIATGLKAPLSLLLREREGGFVTVIPSDLIIEESGSMRAYTLFPFDPIRSFEAFVIEFEAGCIHQSDAHAENVEETVFVISGKLDITVNGHAETLSDGQAARFRADPRISTATLTASFAAYTIRYFIEEIKEKIMFELHQVGEHTFFIESPAKIGVYLAGNGAYLIDSGNDKDTGRRIRKILDDKGWQLRGIINTHSNADHIGGNRYLQQQTGCKIFSAGIEKAFTENPILEPSFLYGGFPCKELRHKFLLAAESKVTDFSDGDFPSGLEIIPLGGHFFNMTGFRTPDDVVFLADCLSSRETLAKYRIGFIYDIAEYLNTLERVKEMTARMFVPSHAAATDNIADLAQYNIDKVNEIADRITVICTTPIGFERILQSLFTEYGLKMTFEQYVLVGSTVRSYLAWLHDTGRLGVDFEDNMMLWSRI